MLRRDEIEEGVAKIFLPNIAWEDAPKNVRERCHERAREIFKYLDAQGVKMAGGVRLIKIKFGG
jgi:hypothetical protein